MRPDLRTPRLPKTAKVDVRAPRPASAPTPASTETVLKNQTQLQETTIRTLTDTKNLIELGNEATKELFNALHEVLQQVSAAKVTELHEALKDFISQELGNEREQLKIFAKNLADLIKQAANNHTAASQSVAEEFHALRRESVAQRQSTSEEIHSLQTKHGELETRVESLQARLEDVASDLSQRFAALQEEQRVLNAHFSNELQALKTSQAEMEAKHLNAIGAMNDIITKRLNSFNTVLETIATNHKTMLDYFIDVAQKIKANQSVAVKCSKCSRNVMRYETMPDASVACVNCLRQSKENNVR